MASQSLTKRLNRKLNPSVFVGGFLSYTSFQKDVTCRVKSLVNFYPYQGLFHDRGFMATIEPKPYTVDYLCRPMVVVKRFLT